MLHLPQVTLCAVTSVNLAATLRSLEASMAQIAFGACKIFTDAPIDPVNPALQAVPIAPIHSSAAYSEFILTGLAQHVHTSHCLIVQWDGHVLDAGRWNPAFLDYDYIGAAWPQFNDGHDVGNGGFSLRSRRLLEACNLDQFCKSHPEDLAIGRVNRLWLEAQGMQFADRDVADQFSTERTGDLCASFGYHGVFNMPRALGADGFWEIYRKLDDKSTLRRDFIAILSDVLRSKNGFLRAVRMIADKLRHSPVFRRRSPASFNRARISRAHPATRFPGT